MRQDSRHGELSAVLAESSETEILALLADAEPLATGIGGSTARARVLGSDVFVKQLPLTTVEREDPTSTANRFGLPVSCHYGVGSPGFGVGREIAAHELTSSWVTSGVTDSFPVLYHWRVLDQRCRIDVSEFQGDAPPRRWGAHWPRVRDRVAALSTARCSVVLFLEYVPDTLDTWLRAQFASGDPAAALSTALQQISAATAWLGVNDLQHLDLHPRNILVREGSLLLTDFGLALHRSFAMDDDERAFFASHGRYDHDTGISSLLHWVLAELGVRSRGARLDVLRAAAADGDAAVLAFARTALGDGADLIAQHARVGAATTSFLDALMRDASAATCIALPEPRGDEHA